MTRNLSVLQNSARTCLMCSIILLLMGCQTIVPIVKPVKYYSARSHAVDVDYIPDGTVYIGTVKVVPGDDALLRSKSRKQRAIRKMLAAAAKAGADYVVITDIDKTNKDYWLDITYSAGYTIEGEMFRLTGE